MSGVSRRISITDGAFEEVELVEEVKLIEEVELVEKVKLVEV